MHAAILEQFGAPLVIGEVDLNGMAPDEVLVRVVASGICHSDRTVHLGAQDRPLPLVLGHESSGVVERVGSAVTRFAPGDHVVGAASACCGTCAFCLRGLTQHCVDKGLTRTGGGPRLTRDGGEVHAFIGLGGFADHMLVSERALVRLPGEMPLEAAALLGCAVLTGVGAVRHRANVRAGQSVAVIGCGGVGLNAIQGARLVGATRIIAVDLNQVKLERAVEFGATDLVNAAADDPVEAVLALTRGGADHAIEVVGLGATIEQAFGMAGVHGQVTVVGVARPQETITLPAAALVTSEKSVQGSRLGSADFRVDIPLYCEMYLRGQLMLDELISEVIDLAEVTRGLEQLDGSDGARSVIHFPSAAAAG